MRLTKEYDAPAIHVTENGSAWLDEPTSNGYVADTERADYLTRISTRWPAPVPREPRCGAITLGR
jgi:beta-glucosidase/6-phospho-beta-glucosidase/beta-galactosidase